MCVCVCVWALTCCLLCVAVPVFAPRVLDSSSNMSMLRITSLADLQPNSMNIMEPTPLDLNDTPREDCEWGAAFAVMDSNMLMASKGPTETGRRFVRE